MPTCSARAPPAWTRCCSTGWARPAAPTCQPSDRSWSCRRCSPGNESEQGMLPSLPRSDAAELLDAPIADLGALADNLRDLRALDRYLGGTALTWRALLPMLRRLPPGAPATLLDVATGAANGPRRLAALARRHGYDLRPVASDRLREVLRFARADGVTFPL